MKKEKKRKFRLTGSLVLMAYPGYRPGWTWRRAAAGRPTPRRWARRSETDDASIGTCNQGSVLDEI